MTGIGQVHGRTVAIVANDATGGQVTTSLGPTQCSLCSNGANCFEQAHILCLDAAVKGGTYYPITVKVGKLSATLAFTDNVAVQQSNIAIMQ